MPKRKQPTRLEELAFRQYANIYISKCHKWKRDMKDALNDGEEAYICVLKRVLEECRTVGEVLSTNPPGVLKLLCRPLVTEFFKLMALHNRESYKLRDFALILHRHVSKITIAYLSVLGRFIERLDAALMPNSMDELTVLENLDRVPGLLELTLSNLSLTNQWNFVHTAIHHVKRLQVFKYRNYCNDEVIHQLRLHCPRLTEVDVSESREVTNASALDIIELKELKWLNLNRTRIDDENYGFIISKLPKIANIRFWLNESIVLFHTGLRTIDTITHINGCIQNMDAVSQTCPNTTNITIRPVFPDLSLFTAFEALRALNLRNLSYGASNLNTVFSGIGHRLQDLTLSNCSDVNLQDIVILCPSLVNLSVKFCSILELNTQLDPELPHFRNLINLKLKIRPGIITMGYICHYVNVEELHLEEAHIAIDQFVTEIVSLGTFKQLALLHIEEYWSADSNMGALQLLIQHCPRLKRIEGLSRCPQLTGALIEEFKRQILQQNLDLEIVD
jgi:hypothetical protein